MRHALEKFYNVGVLHVTPAPRGFYAETYRVETDGASYFLKMLDTVKFPRLSSNFERSLPAVDMLYSHYEIRNLCRPIQNKTGSYSFQHKQWVGALFEFLDGHYTDQYDIRKYVDLLARIHAVDTTDMPLSKETADIYYAHEFEHYIARVFEQPACDEVVEEVKEFLSARKDEIQCDWHELHAIQRRVKSHLDPSTFVVTHSDGPGNIMVKDHELYLIDWDDVKLAPVERDLWIHFRNPTCEPLSVVFFERYADHFPDYTLNELYWKFYLYLKYFEYLTVVLRVIFDADFGERRASEVQNLKETYLNWPGKIIRSLDKVM